MASQIAQLALAIDAKLDTLEGNKDSAFQGAANAFTGSAIVKEGEHSTLLSTVQGEEDARALQFTTDFNDAKDLMDGYKNDFVNNVDDTVADSIKETLAKINEVDGQIDGSIVTYGSDMNAALQSEVIGVIGTAQDVEEAFA